MFRWSLLLGLAATVARADIFSVQPCKPSETRHCRTPTWPATYAMNMSTIIMPCNYSGFYDFDAFPELAKFGVIDYVSEQPTASAAAASFAVAAAASFAVCCGHYCRWCCACCYNSSSPIATAASCTVVAAAASTRYDCCLVGLLMTAAS